MGFGSFLGNTKAVSAVRSMLATDRVPGALLFSGPEGVGKQTLAVMLAKAINCENRVAAGDDFCGECRLCRKGDEMLAASADDLARRRDSKNAERRTENLICFDLQIIEPLTRYILTEQIRQVRSAAYSRPFELSHRIFIIDQAQAIHWQAADLLLKILEEPPETTTLILVCPNPHELPTTIRSRSVRVPFTPVEDSILEPIVSQDKRIRPDQKALALRLIGGSVAKAKSFDFADYNRQRQPWVDFVGALASGLTSSRGGHWEKLLSAAKTITADRAQWEVSLGVGYLLCRDLVVSFSEPDGRLLINTDLKPQLGDWGRQMGFQRLKRLMGGLDESYRLRGRNVNPQIGLEALAADLLAGAS